MSSGNFSCLRRSMELRFSTSSQVGSAKRLLAVRSTCVVMVALLSPCSRNPPCPSPSPGGGRPISTLVAVGGDQHVGHLGPRELRRRPLTGAQQLAHARAGQR